MRKISPQFRRAGSGPPSDYHSYYQPLFSGNTIGNELMKSVGFTQAQALRSNPDGHRCFRRASQAARREEYAIRFSGVKPAERAADAKARRATPTGTMQSIAAWTCCKAIECALSVIGHFLRSQYLTCSIVVNFCTSPLDDMTKDRGFPQLISINQISFLKGERNVRMAS